MKKIAYLLWIAIIAIACDKKHNERDPTPDPPDPPADIVLTDTTTVQIELPFEKLLRDRLIFSDDQIDGKVKYGKIKNLDSINISTSDLGNFQLTKLKSIKYFTALRYLNISGSYVDSLDLSKNSALEYLNCAGLSTGGGLLNPLKYIDIQKCEKLKYLNVYCNQLNKLNISKNLQLEYLYCGSNSLDVIDFSSNKYLKEIDVSYNKQIASLDLNGVIDLTHLYCEGNKIKKLDTSKLTNLKVLDCAHNWEDIKEGVSIDVSRNINLTSFDFSGFPGDEIDISNNRKLEVLECSLTGIKSIDISGLKELQALICSYSKSLTKIDISKNARLEYLEIAGTTFPAIDLTNNVKLKTLACYFQEELRTLDLRNCTSLERVLAFGCTKLKTICVTKIPDPGNDNWRKDTTATFALCK